ncbi:MAG: GcrA cell cycle regulator [Alphaproteobacteria bacterium]|nr:GcrA cell cycle regulator [Alphaproteobacteria bacterium]
MDWTEDMIARLRALWLEGHSTAEIGRRMAVSKNAVVGKAHRLGLAARPSPIRRDGPAGSTRTLPPRRTLGPTLPPLACAHAPAGEAPLPAASVQAPAPQTAPPVVRAVAPRPSRSVACCWPIGEPGTKSFRFCDEEALPGKPYCAAHAQLAYVKVRDRREEAA